MGIWACTHPLNLSVKTESTCPAVCTSSTDVKKREVTALEVTGGLKPSPQFLPAHMAASCTCEVVCGSRKSSPAVSVMLTNRHCEMFFEIGTLEQFF